jgi:hypothetical protein
MSVLEKDTTSSEQKSVSHGPCLLQAQVVVRNVADEVMIELSWSSGTCGRDTLHQVLQFIKNHIKN